MKKRILYIKRKRFCEWYFDNESIKIIGNDVIDDLMHSGKYSITLEDCLKQIGYIPVDLIINKKNIFSNEDISDWEIEGS